MMDCNIYRERVVQIFAVRIADYSLELYSVTAVAEEFMIKLDRQLMDIQVSEIASFFALALLLLYCPDRGRMK